MAPDASVPDQPRVHIIIVMPLSTETALLIRTPQGHGMMLGFEFIQPAVGAGHPSIPALLS